MLLSCFRRNVEASCHTHYSSSPAINKLRRFPATSVINSPWSVAAECWRRWRSKSSQHAMEPQIASELWLYHTPPAFDAPVRGGPRRHKVWYGKSRMVWLPDGEKSLRIRLLVLTECTSVTDRQTDAAWRHRPRLHMITPQKSAVRSTGGIRASGIGTF